MPQRPVWRKVEFIRPVFGQLHVGQNLRMMATKSCRLFQIPKECNYSGYCDDFGPFNIANVLRFNSTLNAELKNCGLNQKLILKVGAGRRALSNAIFMLGAYMILEQKKRVNEVETCFSWINSSLVEDFRDATYAAVDFELSILDCWRALARGLQIGWIGSSNEESNRESVPSLDIRVYEHFDNPLNGDMHVVVPGKIIAFAGPVNLPQGIQYRDSNGFRVFSAAHYARPFSMLGVTDVVQLNYYPYDASPFLDKGVKVHPLPFEDCTCPTEDIVDSFLRIVDNARGLVAVHCRAGLGRTGTLIARYLMRTHGFVARQAIGWLRVLRPGSVIGPQQQYLCNVDTTPAASEPADSQPPSPNTARPRSLRLRTSLSRSGSAPASVAQALTAESAEAVAAAGKEDGAGRPALGLRPARPQSLSAQRLHRPSRSLDLADLSPPPPAAASRRPETHPPAVRTGSSAAASTARSPLAAQVRDGMAARGAARIAARLTAGSGTAAGGADRRRAAAGKVVASRAQGLGVRVG